jgi:glycerol-3-phosphate acyltransferase PlsY
VNEAGKLILLYLFAYMAGSIPTANVIAWLVKGIDLRRYGSGNVGGSNLYKHVGIRWLFPMGFIDLFIKGAAPVWLGHYSSFFGYGLPSAELVGAGLIAIAGHNWSPYLRFTGGRGIAVAIGAMYAIAKWEMALFAGVAFCI